MRYCDVAGSSGKSPYYSWHEPGGIDLQVELWRPVDSATEGRRTMGRVEGCQYVGWRSVHNITGCVDRCALIIADDIAHRKAFGEAVVVILCVDLRRYPNAKRIQESRARCLVIEIVVDMYLAVAHTRHSLHSVLKFVVVQRDVQFAYIKGWAIRRAKQHRLVVVGKTVPRDSDQIGTFSNIAFAVMLLKLTTKVLRLLAIKQVSISERNVVNPDMRRVGENRDVVERGVPVAGSAIGRVPLRETVEGVLELDVTDDNVVDILDHEVGTHHASAPDAHNGRVRWDKDLHTFGLILLGCVPCSF